MREDHGFHIASVGKVITAILVLKCLEKGLLGKKGLDARIDSFDCIRDVTTNMRCLSDSPVTVRQLLNHSSGLRDAFSDDGRNTAVELGGTPAPGSLSSHLRRAMPSDAGDEPGWPAWRPESAGDPLAGVLNWFIWGGKAADALVHHPGERFHYSDTGYMVLALLVEGLAGRSYEDLSLEHVFQPLGMRETYLAYGQKAPPDWRRTVSDFAFGGQGAFSQSIDVSWDWGGGGQISTAGDLERLLRGLFSRKLFSRAGTLREMVRFQQLPGLPPNCTGIGLGVRRLRSPQGTELWGHAGAWSVQAFYAPEFDATITGTFNQPMAAGNFLRNWVLDVADSLRDLRVLGPDMLNYPFL